MRWDPTPHAHPEVWAMVLGLLAAYLIAERHLGERAGRRATRKQILFFGSGLLTILIAAEYPIHDLAEGSLYSVHMLQHILLTLVAPPLLMLGTPDFLARAMLPGKVLNVVRFLTRPLIALIIFNAAIIFTHWPKIVDASVHSELWHFLLHTLIVTAALIMWTPVVSPLLELPRLSYPGQMMYLFLQSLVPTVPASFLTFGSRPLYHVYETLPRAWGISALSDQRAAGLIMKIVGGAVLWAAITVLYFRWFKMEHTEGVDAVEWHHDVDKTLSRMELGQR
jgi:putative membrane protein